MVLGQPWLQFRSRHDQ